MKILSCTDIPQKESRFASWMTKFFRLLTNTLKTTIAWSLYYGPYLVHSLWTLYLPIFYRIESIDFSIGVSDQSMKLDKAHLSVTFRNKNHSPTIFTVSWNLVILWFGLIFRPLNKLKTRNECLKCMHFLNQTSSLSLTVKITFVPFGKAV